MKSARSATRSVQLRNTRRVNVLPRGRTGLTQYTSSPCWLIARQGSAKSPVRLSSSGCTGPGKATAKRTSPPGKNPWLTVGTPAEPGTSVGAGVEGTFVDVGVGVFVAVGAGAARVALAGGWVACKEADRENREADGAATPKARMAIGTSRVTRLIRDPFFGARGAARAGAKGWVGEGAGASDDPEAARRNHYRIREAAVPCRIDRSASLRDSYFGTQAPADRSAAVRMYSTVNISKPDTTISASWRSRWRVIGLGMATQYRPAALAAWMPWIESSQATAPEACPFTSCKTAR